MRASDTNSFYTKSYIKTASLHWPPHTPKCQQHVSKVCRKFKNNLVTKPSLNQSNLVSALFLLLLLLILIFFSFSSFFSSFTPFVFVFLFFFILFVFLFFYFLFFSSFNPHHLLILLHQHLSPALSLINTPSTTNTP